MAKINKDIIVLSEYEHLRKRPEMYVGSITTTEERIPIIENNKIVEKVKSISIGMYKCFDEIFDNSFDEIKRQYSKGIKNGKIIVKFNSKENSIEISDNGGGFQQPDKIHSVSGKTNVETALSQLRAGSNFNNEDIDENLIGTNGVGAAIVNVLSEYFSVETCDGNINYKHEWQNFKTINTETKKSKISGTTIKFILDKKMFPKMKWDFEILKSKLIFKNFLKNETYLKNVDIEFYINDNLQNLDVNFIPLENINYEKTLPRMSMKVYAWKCFSGSTSISFINDSMCQGIHQKIVLDEINQKVFDYEKAHNFYETLIIINLQPKYVKFGDQNKTKFIGTRNELQSIINFELSTKLIKQYKETDFFYDTIDDIEKSLQKNELKKIKKNKRQNKTKISEKYFPSETQDSLFIVEGHSAAGSILQERNPKLHGVYSLKGKIKNVKYVSDLSNNQEILDLIAILDLDLETKGEKCKFKKIVIATDADPDGDHIASLIINFFHKWFPKIIENGKLFILETPLIRAETKKDRTYFYSHEDFNNNTIKFSSTKYLKGLGSLDEIDWKFVFEYMSLKKIYIDRNSDKILEIAFGNNPNKRKRWLEK